jgi:hypothetical protein
MSCFSLFFKVINCFPHVLTWHNACRYSSLWKWSIGVDLFEALTHDKDIPTIHDLSHIYHLSSNLKDTMQGSFTRSCAKKLQEQVNSFLINFNFNISENVILPKCSILIAIRNTYEEKDETDHKDHPNKRENRPACSDIRSDQCWWFKYPNWPLQRTCHNFLFLEPMKVNKDILEILWSLLFSARSSI